jgi:hypothetical protein
MLRQWCAGIVIASGIGCAQHPNAPISSLLARRVPAYSVQSVPRLNALVRFGRENGVPLRIEFSTTELDEPVNVSTSASDVRGVLSAILGLSRQYSLSSSHGTVSIRAGRPRHQYGWITEFATCASLEHRLAGPA